MELTVPRSPEPHRCPSPRVARRLGRRPRFWRPCAVLTLALAVLASLCAPAHSAESWRFRPVGPGVRLSTADVSAGDGTRHLSALGVDLGRAEVSYLGGDSVASSASLPDMAADAGAVAAVNGDYFDIGASSAPLGAAVRDGRVLTSPSQGHTNAATLDAAGTGRVGPVEFTGTASLPGGELPIDRLNSHEIPRDGAGVFTADWGDHPRERATHDAGHVTEVVVDAHGTVRDVRESIAGSPVEPRTRVLVGRESSADRLARLRPGDAVDLDYRLTADGTRPELAVGGRHILLRDGTVTDVPDTARAPRTAIGFSADGRRMFVVTADGRVPGTTGATLTEMGRRLKDAGADDGLELDGGGSAQLLARDPGSDALTARNLSGSEDRPVPNGLAVGVPQGTGRASALWVHPTIEPRPPRGSSVPYQADPHRVFTGLRRTLDATAHDDTHGPVDPPGAPRWRWDTSTGEVDDGVYTGGAPGPAAVTARSGDATGDIELDVVPGPDRVTATPSSLHFPRAGGSSTLVLTGIAPDGTRAPIEPADARFDVDADLARVAKRDDGAVTVRPRADHGEGAIVVTAGGRTVRVPVRVGSEDVPISGFDDAAEWTAAASHADAAARRAEGREGDGLALSYAFGPPLGPRSAYAEPPAPIALDRRAFEFSLWVRGDGGGASATLGVTDANGAWHSLDGPDVTWTGWREVEFDVEDGLAHPLTVERVSFAAPDEKRTSDGEITIDTLGATASPSH